MPSRDRAMTQDSLIPFNVPYLPLTAAERLLSSLKSRKFAGDGPATSRATKALSRILDEAEVLLTPSCTHALEMAVRLLGVGPGDEIIVPSFTFTSTANAVVLAGATPVFVDIEPITQNIDVTLVEAAITPRTRAVFCINYAGVAPHVHHLRELCDRHGLVLLEDNAHGLGASTSGKKLGTIGAMATQSFHETKNVQCGEGGCLVINDALYLEAAEIIREKGTDRSRFFRGQVDKYTWVREGSSWLLADTLAALLESQLAAFEEIQSLRGHIWNSYKRGLEDWSRSTGVTLMTVPEHCIQPFHMFYLMTNSLAQRSDLIAHLRASGIQAAFHYQPLHSSEAGLRYGKTIGDLVYTQRASDQLLRLPLWAGMSDTDIAKVVEGVITFQK